MRAPLAKLVRQEFKTKLHIAAPEFESNKTEKVPAGCQLYSALTPEGVAMYIMLQLDSRWDCFTVEAAISVHNRHPSNSFVGTFDAPENGELSFRITRLWAPYDNNQTWWWLGANRLMCAPSFDGIAFEEAIDVLAARVPTVINDCVHRISNDVLPFLRMWAKKQKGEVDEPPATLT